MIRRRLQLSFLACLFALLVATSAALPSPMLWQCRHATGFVIAPFAPKPAVMPCRMGGQMPSPRMACCLPPRAASPSASPTKRSISRPACNPNLVALADSPAAKASQPLQSQFLPLIAFTGPLPAPTIYFAPATITLSQRPLPGGLFVSDAVSHPRLRAPPTA